MLAHDAGEVPGQGCVRARTAVIDAGSARSVAFDEAASARAGAAPGTGPRRTARILLASSRHAILAHDAGEVPGQGCVRARTAAIDAGSARSVAFDEAASARAGAAPRNRATAHCADSFCFFTPHADDFVDAATT